MVRVYHTFHVEDSNLLKQQMLAWSSRFNICCFLDNNHYQSNYNSFDCLLGVGTTSIFQPSADFFSSLAEYMHDSNDYIFGHFNYEIKNIIEGGISLPPDDGTCFPDCFLFVPKILIELKESTLKIGVIDQEADSIFSEIMKQHPIDRSGHVISFQQKIYKEDYLHKVELLQKHIQHGDCYVINFCHQFFATAEINPVSIYTQLSNISPNPFSAFYRIDNNYLLCASPERYVKKIGDKLISQPIKGTSARKHFDLKEDGVSKIQLKNSAKDQSENVMVVDLVRNDLSKICEEGSVAVEELFGIYSFPHVHQMISTVVGRVEKDQSFSNILKATFPMGSMTGAPKKKVMELVDKYEQSKRGIYSGTVGYITPNKDFDFNVVIRSIVYNTDTKNVSFHAGSAITASSQPDEEYEECLLKAQAIIDVFSETKKRNK
ncbi:anthranilate synthase component I family protein [Segetibacter sp.]|uniref:anthranilate synthase component I family protein n=1 Tax=Segetibacter sp. TaxID=2231182 RepID=UPI002625ADEE|nr:anthranilate synthase component I family protein [Segetibacter sp.]MCW3082043.1 Aminodeoxychorismate synthase [Segetibacter sp.]